MLAKPDLVVDAGGGHEGSEFGLLADVSSVVGDLGLFYYSGVLKVWFNLLLLVRKDLGVSLIRSSVVSGVPGRSGLSVTCSLVPVID